MFKEYIMGLLIATICLTIVSCSSGPVKEPDNTEQEAEIPKINYPVFNHDSAYYYVKKQVEFGARVPQTEAHQKCLIWMSSKLKTFCNKIIVQKGSMKLFNGKQTSLNNLIGVINPEADFRILLCAHWDSRPFADQDEDPAKHKTPIDGANDGASGVGVLIELARIIKENPVNIGIDLILFDLEDYGKPEWETVSIVDNDWCLGSEYWSKNPHVFNYRANYGILLDMVGVENAQFTQEGISADYAQPVLNKVWSAASRSGYEKYFIVKKTHPINDDHYNLNIIAKIPTINIIHHDESTKHGFFRYWHTTKDNIEFVDKNTLKAVGQTLITVIYDESEKHKANP